MSTFICYRGERVDNGIGLHIAAQLYELIRNDPSFQPVFFSPEHKDNDFIKDACNFIAEADNLFVILSPNFFSGFVKDGQPNPDSVTYHELKSAFANENCTFRVIRTYGFEWNDSALENLHQCYPDSDHTRLIHRTGLVLQGNAICVQDIQRFRTNTDGSPCTPVEKGALLQDLDDCVNTIFDAKIPLDPDSMLSDIFEYLHMNPQRKLLFPNAFRQEFARVSQECGLSDRQFCYWPVDLLSQDAEQPPTVSICAICFGTLMLHHWLTIDQYNSSPVDAESLNEIQSTIDGAINLLIALRSPVSGSWPASWNFDSTGVDGTINQTTLSLSTLLSCGFLSTDLEEEIFKKRYHYIAKSIEWLLSAANTTRHHFQLMRGWGHMHGNSDSAVLPTAFVTDTLLKFYSCLSSWTEAYPQDSDFCNELEEMRKVLQLNLCQCVRFFRHSITESGGICAVQDPSVLSVSHTAKVMKTLLRFLQITDDAPPEIRQIARETVEKTKLYLSNVNVNRLLHLSAPELFEPFSYTDHAATAEASANFQPNSGENFEMCGELSYFDAMIHYYLSGEVPSGDEIANISHIFRQFRDAVSTNVGGRFLIRGHRPDYPQCPIYALYYYRMVLEDLHKWITASP